MNLVSWVILGILVVIFALVVLIMVKCRDKGCCGCNKEGCPFRKREK